VCERLGGVGLAILLACGATAAQAPKLDAGTQAKVRKLQLERRDTLEKVLRSQLNYVKAGQATPLALVETSGELLEAELDLAAKDQERVAAHAGHLEVAKWAENFTEAMSKAGVLKPTDFQRTRAARLKAEVRWLKAGGKDSTKEVTRKEFLDLLSGKGEGKKE
jgi:hypothetical protein